MNVDGWEIPELTVDMQATEIALPAMIWGGISRSRIMPGTYLFYEDDFKFQGLWAAPEKILATRCKVAVEMNWSTRDHSDYEEVLTGIYCKRVMSVYWALHGIKVIVDLNLAPYYVEGMALLGVPEGWNAYATRAHRESRMGFVEEQYRLAQQHSGLYEPFFVVYGGGKKTAAYCADRPWHHIPEHIEVARGRMKPYGWTHNAIGD